MTRNDIRVQFNKEKDLHVLQTEGTGYIHYTDDYVHWLEDIALMQANGVEQSTSNCNITLVSNLLIDFWRELPELKKKYLLPEEQNNMVRDFLKSNL